MSGCPSALFVFGTIAQTSLNRAALNRSESIVRWHPDVINGMLCFAEEIKYRGKGILWQLQYKDRDHSDVDIRRPSAFINDQVHENASSSVNDLSINPCSRLRIVFNTAIPQSLNLQLAEGNALKIMWQDSTRSGCLVSFVERSPNLFAYLR